MGHNCGVTQVADDSATRVLETTWTPRYTQPRIVPTDANGVERHARALSQPDSFADLAPLVPAMQEWIDQLPTHVNPADGLELTDTAGISRERNAFGVDLGKWAAEMESC